jgi:hypothetical protein
MLTARRLSVLGPGKHTVSKSEELLAVAAFAKSEAVSEPVDTAGVGEPATLAIASECSNCMSDSPEIDNTCSATGPTTVGFTSLALTV